MKDIIESNLPKEQRRVYQEDKSVSQLMRKALSEDQRESREALLELRGVFYEKKHALETLQKMAGDADRAGMKAFFWKGDQARELGRITNLCRSIVALFNDMDMNLHERRSSPRTSNPTTHPGRQYTGLGEE